MEQQLFDALHYFLRFQYPPTLSEIHRYMHLLVSEFEVKREMERLQTAGAIRIEQERVFLIDRNYDGYFVRKQQSEELLGRARSYLTNLEYIPSIQLIGISGSMSMLNGTSLDDIDLFIITRSGYLWSTRFLVLIYKKLICLVNPTLGRKLCFNMFFAEDGLKISKEKQNIYVAHEILQLKVFYNKKGIYHKFLAENDWVNTIFPNANVHFETAIEATKYYSKVSIIESILGSIQKWWLRRTHYVYKEMNNQLWLIQKDWSNEV